MEVLYRLRQKRPDVFQNTEGDYRHSISLRPPQRLTFCIVYVDGGVRRGTGLISLPPCWFVPMGPLIDVLKALCLGARAVGLGRPFLYAQSVSLLVSLSHPY